MHETAPAQTAGRPVPVWTTVVTVLLIPVAFFFGALAPMAEEDAHPRTVAVVIACWWASWTATPLLVVASRTSPRRPVLARARRGAGWVALVPPTVVIVLVLGL
ncbi:hypothetical protein ACWDYJ_23215 [Streptomyces sp. NPDC003042]